MRMQSPKTSPQPVPKPVRWVASSKDDLSAFPNDVKTRVGGALWDARIGLKSSAAKPLKGFGHAGVLELVVDFGGNTFRTVYTVRFAKAGPSRVPEEISACDCYAEDRSGSDRNSARSRQRGL
jgi:Phage derived protein Gp49-like (DUF891)